MADERPPIREEENSPPIDPFEAELVAYLDGELDDAAARKVAARLAGDPAARSKAAALKKTFDLLDYLPRPEPSANFTTRTLEQLPAVKTTAVPSLSSTAAASASASASVPRLTNAMASPLEEPPRQRRALWPAGVLLTAASCALGGYLVTAAVTPSRSTKESPARDELPISDRGVVEHLPLYAAADDYEFVRSIASPEFFGDDPAVTFDARLNPEQPLPESVASGPAFEKLAVSFKALPAERQEVIRELHKHLFERVELAERNRLFRVLEVYTIWLNRLPAGQRRIILGAATASQRLDEIRELLNRQWLDSLPPSQRAKLTGLSASEKAEVIGKWKMAEAERREEWVLVRDHAEDIAANRVPWPFDDPARKKDIIEFIRFTFHPDNAKRSRLTANEFDRLNATFKEANEKQGWAWHGYGKLIYDATSKYEPWLLPEPAAGEPITRVNQLPKLRRYFEGPGAKSVQPVIGKWPDFALRVHAAAQFMKGERLPPLGPAKPSEFKEPLQTFVTKDLTRSLTPNEKRTLEGLEGKWPEYPREVLRLSKIHNLSAPGMMLPGSPRQWDNLYRTRIGPSRGGFGKP
ncbi:MAG TPA: hypothetical protein VLM40_23125 [Gemmata sp.]|nr:hypothetical protein [Gemmata sp.]